ncbi:MAG: hypothetical protein GY810_26665 [Aureispira sp.]|nr:hypothetical protein [Aureispira sp.]
MRFLTVLSVVLFSITNSLHAQSSRNDIPISKLPKDVKAVLVEYINILTSSETLDACADNMLKVAGGSLINEQVDENGTALSLRRSIQPYSLKKDFQNIKFYQNPIKITRVNLSSTNGSGYGDSAIAGKVYKIWIGKKSGVAGMPAPITVVLPTGHARVKTPKITGIGSL